LVLTVTACILVSALASSGATQKSASKAPPKLTGAQEKALDNYRTICQPCHGPDGKAVLKDMILADAEWKHGTSQEAIVKTISEGVKGTAMLPFKSKLSKAEIVELAKLVRSFGAKSKAVETAPATKKQ
jgi:mono/diheme cytochrome c family protein